MKIDGVSKEYQSFPSEKSANIAAEMKNDGEFTPEKYAEELRHQTDLFALAEQYISVLNELKKYPDKGISDEKYKEVLKRKMKIYMKLKGLLPEKSDKSVTDYINEVAAIRQKQIIKGVDIGNARTIDYFLK